MCGISGILSVDAHQDKLEEIVRRMQSTLKHRGPDDCGIYLSADRQAAFAHTRLAILDLSSSGHQPMSTADGRYWITFSGEIYNFRELRQDLIEQGEQFYSQTDTEVILKLYQRHGRKCVELLRGMFAFAIWDTVEQSCFLARDPLGIKPLYYWQSGATLVFASELRTVLASGLPTIQLNLLGLYGYLTTGSVPEPQTLISNIQCLEAGHWLYWTSKQLIQQQYWQISFPSDTASSSDAVQIIRDAVTDSIRYHLVSDVPVGLFLSGGIDSTTILALASQMQSQPIKTYSIAFAESQWNEGEIAKKIAGHFGADHTEHKLTAASASRLFPQYLAALDQPSVDGFNTFCVSHLAHENGAKVVLSGLGGDELFSGYPSFQKVPQMVSWSKKLQAVPGIAPSLGALLSHGGKSSKLRRLGEFLQQPPHIAAAYQSFRGIFSHREACSIIRHWFPDQTKLFDRMPAQAKQIESMSPEDAVSFLELTSYMRNQLLRDSDVMSMAWGLELRVPLVDRNLLESISAIPSAIRLAANKQLLIQAVPELPNWVTNQSKRGFTFPFEQWMAGEWKDYFSNTTYPAQLSLQSWYQRWSLVMFQHWWRQVAP